MLEIERDKLFERIEGGLVLVVSEVCDTLEKRFGELGLGWRIVAEFLEDFRKAPAVGVNLVVDDAVVERKVVACLAEPAHDRFAFRAVERAEHGEYRVLEVLHRDCPAGNDERALVLADGFGNDVRGDAYLGCAGQGLDCIRGGLLVESVNRDLGRMRVGRVQEVMVGRVVYLVEVGLLEDGFLELETFVAQESLNESGIVGLLLVETAFQTLLEQQAVRVEEGKADAVARELPLLFGGDGLLEEREVEQNAELAVDGRIFGARKLYDVLEALAEDDVLDGPAVRYGNRLHVGANIERHENARGERVAVPLEEAHQQEQVRAKEVLGLALQDGPEFFFGIGLLLGRECLRYGQEIVEREGGARL